MELVVLLAIKESAKGAINKLTSMPLPDNANRGSQRDCENNAERLNFQKNRFVALFPTCVAT